MFIWLLWAFRLCFAQQALNFTNLVHRTTVCSTLVRTTQKPSSSLVFCFAHLCLRLRSPSAVALKRTSHKFAINCARVLRSPYLPPAPRRRQIFRTASPQLHKPSASHYGLFVSGYANILKVCSTLSLITF